MTKAGFKRGKYNHEKVGTKATVHGDDFISPGSTKSLRWFRQVLEKRLDISTVVVGDGREEAEQETKVLNRIIRMDHEGWHYEADQRHGELIVKASNLQEAKSVQTPGEDEKSWQEEEEEDRERLSNQDASQYRALAARANYLALDCPDIQYAVKETCRGMSNPTRGDFRAEAWAPPRLALPKRLPGRSRRGSRLHRLRLGWLQEDSQEHDGWGHLEGTTHRENMVRHPDERDTGLRRSRAGGNGQDEL